MNSITHVYWMVTFIAVTSLACVPPITLQQANQSVPSNYTNAFLDTVNSANTKWQVFFSDPNLRALIDTALKNNQELNIVLQEIEISKNEVKQRKGEYLPFVHLNGAGEIEKVGNYTRYGAVENQLEIKPGIAFPEPLRNFELGASASWEVDVWKKLRNAKKSAISRYLASIEGKNFMITNLIAEISEAYYELTALDNLLEIVEKNIDIQSNALKVVRQQKAAAKVTQLAINRFEAQLLNTKNLQYDIKQKITETENRINFLTGRSPAPVSRNPDVFMDLKIDSILTGVPSQLLTNRPDIRKAELELAAAKLDVKVARATFFPSLDISAGAGFQAFDPKFLINPESILYNLTGDIMAPLVNRNAIKATYSSAGARQVQAVYNYERSILSAHVDVLNQLAKLNNFSSSCQTKSQEVEILMQSVSIANKLFYSARADYAEVLLTQREALESKMELVEVKLKQTNAMVNVYRALGGGWK